MAAALGVPFHAVSHQQGHVAAALWSAGRMELMDVPHLAWHLSGGTTELLLITPEGKNVRAEKLGGTSDILRRTAHRPDGQAAWIAVSGGQGARCAEPGGGCGGGFPCEVNGLTFSFSGLQNKVEGYHAAGPWRGGDGAVCAAVGDRVHPADDRGGAEGISGAAVVFSGGVASNAMLREACAGTDAVFAQPQFSTDNAMGVAILTARLEGLDGAANS